MGMIHVPSNMLWYDTSLRGHLDQELEFGVSSGSLWFPHCQSLLFPYPDMAAVFIGMIRAWSGTFTFQPHTKWLSVDIEVNKGMPHFC